jgi:integrating conjugative element protein (TIGR03759 family)
MRLFIHKYFLLLSLFSLLNTSNAENIINTQALSSTSQNTTINSTVVGTAQDWNLTESEWARYQTLMQGPNGHWYPQLTPPEVLGLNAKTEEEQQHFAEIVAREEHDKLARELLFDRAVHEALLRLYPREPIIRAFDLSPYNPIQASSEKKISLEAGDHLALFVDIKQGFDVATVPQLIAAVKMHPDVMLDIFCVGKVDDNRIRQWASLNHIPLDLVAKHQITLNSDNGKLQKTAGDVPLPYVLWVRNNQSKAISVWSLG